MDGGYSKINIIHSQNSRSIDLSDLVSFSTTPPKSTSKIQLESNLQIKNKLAGTDKQEDDEIQHQDTRFGNGNGSHVVLKRKCSVSSSSSSSGFQSAVKGAIFSMRSSSSTASERYSRMHDQSVTLALPTCIEHDGEDGDDWGTTRSNKKRYKGGKILKACKRLFGLL